MRATPLIDPFADTLTVPEVAEFLGVSERHVWRLLKAGDLEAFRTGERRTYVTVGSVRQHLTNLQANT